MEALLSINVNDKTEKKGQLTYLSWAWAWAEVLKADAAATWTVHTYGPQGNEQPCMWIGETAMVHTSVTIKGLRRECMLPVMDHKNNALKNPDARKISDAIMRCMTKAVSMHGLGLYIYAGEDLPQVDGPEEPDVKPKQAEIKKSLGVKADVLETSGGIAPDRKEWLRELAARVGDAFDAYGAQAAYETIEAEGLEDLDKIQLAVFLGSRITNQIKAYSRALHAQPA